MGVLKSKLCEDTHEHFEKQTLRGYPWAFEKTKLCEDTHGHFESTKLCEDTHGRFEKQTV